MAYHVGQRLSLKGQLCTVRYLGSVHSKSGDWLGVEWDDPARGKHNGTHQGVEYFECRSSSPTVASFLRPDQPWDEPRSFYQAVREKYMAKEDAETTQTVYFSSKQAEEVGFGKFAQRQAALQGIHVLVLDRMRIQYRGPEDDDVIRDACKDITELDISCNLFESLGEILRLVNLLPKLMHLVLDGNRFDVDESSTMQLARVFSLSLSNTLLHHSAEAIGQWVSRHFPNVKSFKVANDERHNTVSLGAQALPASLRSLDLARNDFANLADLHDLCACDKLEKLNVEKCQIEDAGPLNTCINKAVLDLDLAHNKIKSWDVVDALPTAFPALKQLRMTGNPLYSHLKSATGKPLLAEDGYMLTIARLPRLEMLNYSKITEKERLNAEKYYLSEIAAELAALPPDGRQEVSKRHPRWSALCEEYGEPVIPDQSTISTINPRSLAARLITITCSFHSHPDWQLKIPKSFNIYSVLGLIGNKVDVMPLDLRLIWETGEEDPLGIDGRQDGIVEWDSDEEDEESSKPEVERVAREVELVPGTRTLGTYIDGPEAKLRVEVRSRS